MTSAASTSTTNSAFAPMGPKARSPSPPTPTPTPTPPPRSLWADLSDEAEDDLVCRSTSSPWEWLSSHTAESFDEDMHFHSSRSGTNLKPASSLHPDDGHSSANRCQGALWSDRALPSQNAMGSDFYAPIKEDQGPWASTSSIEVYSSMATGTCPLPSSSSTSWSVSASHSLLDASSPPAPAEVGASSFPSNVDEAEAPVVPTRRLRIKNKKLEAVHSTGNSGAKDVTPTEVSTSPTAPPATPAQVKPSYSFSQPKGEGEWSIGSAKHDIGRCRRCLFHDSPVGCIKGASCDFCHLTHYRSSCARPSKAKRDRYARLFQDIAEKRAQKAKALAEQSAVALPPSLGK